MGSIISGTYHGKDKPYVGIKHDGKGWDIRLENHESTKTAWAMNASSAYDKAKLIADYFTCNIIWKSKLGEDGEIIQLSEPESSVQHQMFLDIPE